jgi:hypothetical protein
MQFPSRVIGPIPLSACRSDSISLHSVLRHTRMRVGDASGTHISTMTPTAGAWKGTILGLSNVVVIAMGLAISESNAGVLMLVMIFGAIPGMFLGLLLGLFAGGFPKLAVGARLATLILPSLGLVYLLADEFAMSDYILVAMIPTVVATSILERWTRWREAPPLPQATVA